MIFFIKKSTMAKESVLSIAEKQSIIIDKFIFHIILQNEEEPIYLNEVIISEEQKRFFTDRLIDVSQGNQYLFNDKTTSTIFLNSTDLLKNSNSEFIEASKKLTADFKSRHNKNTSDGVFITALVTIDVNRKLVFLVKLDHKKVYEYKIENSKALLEEIKNTFIEDKSAIQKVALIDISEKYIWEVLAYDRAKPGGLTEYFKNFLGVKLRDTPSKWTRDAITHANSWANINRKILDPEQEPSVYKNRAISYLLSSPLFDSNDYIKAVIHDNDDDRKKILIDSLNDYISEKGLAGQTFPPNKGSIDKKSKTNTRFTNEGVKIEWLGEAKDVNVNIPNERNEDGLYHISIKTAEIKTI